MVSILTDDSTTYSWSSCSGWLRWVIVYSGMNDNRSTNNICISRICYWPPFKMVFHHHWSFAIITNLHITYISTMKRRYTPFPVFFVGRIPVPTCTWAITWLAISNFMYVYRHCISVGLSYFNNKLYKPIFFNKGCNTVYLTGTNTFNVSYRGNTFCARCKICLLYTSDAADE